MSVSACWQNKSIKFPCWKWSRETSSLCYGTRAIFSVPKHYREEKETSLIKDFILSPSTLHGSCLTNPITQYTHPLSESRASASSPQITPLSLLGLSQNTSDSLLLLNPTFCIQTHIQWESSNTAGLMRCWEVGLTHTSTYSKRWWLLVPSVRFIMWVIASSSSKILMTANSRGLLFHRRGAGAWSGKVSDVSTVRKRQFFSIHTPKPVGLISLCSFSIHLK